MYTITVTSTADTTDTGTLRWAIAQANNYKGEDEIEIVFDEALAAQEIILSSELSLKNQVSIINLPGGNAVRISGVPMFFDSSAVVNISGTTLQNLEVRGSSTFTDNAFEGCLLLGQGDGGIHQYPGQCGPIQGSGNTFTQSGEVIRLQHAGIDMTNFHADATQDDAYIAITGGRVNSWEDVHYTALSESLSHYRLKHTVTIYEGGHLTLGENTVLESFDTYGDLIVVGTLTATGSHLQLTGHSTEQGDNLSGITIRQGGTADFRDSTITGYAATRIETYWGEEGQFNLLVQNGGTLNMSGCTLENVTAFRTNKGSHTEITRTTLQKLENYGALDLTESTVEDVITNYGELTTNGTTFNTQLVLNSGTTISGDQNTFLCNGEVITLREATVNFTVFQADATGEDAYIGVHDGSIDRGSDVYWQKLGKGLSVYRLFYDLKVENSALLYMGEGTTLESTDYRCDLHVFGSFSANGSHLKLTGHETEAGNELNGLIIENGGQADLKSTQVTAYAATKNNLSNSSVDKSYQIHVKTGGRLDMDDCRLTDVSFFYAAEQSELNITDTVLQTLQCWGALTLNGSTVEDNLTCSDKGTICGSGNTFTNHGEVLTFIGAGVDLKDFHADATQQDAYIGIGVRGIESGVHAYYSVLGEGLSRYVLNNSLSIRAGGSLTLEEGTSLESERPSSDVEVSGSFTATRSDLKLMGHETEEGGSLSGLIIKNGGYARLDGTQVTAYAATKNNVGGAGDKAYQIHVKDGGCLEVDDSNFNDVNFFRTENGSQLDLNNTVLQNLECAGGTVSMNGNTVEKALTISGNASLQGSGNRFTQSGEVITIKYSGIDLSAFHAEATQPDAYIGVSGTIGSGSVARYSPLGNSLSRYVINSYSSLNINSGASLQLDEGSTLESSHYENNILVNGTLSANGCHLLLMGHKQDDGGYVSHLHIREAGIAKLENTKITAFDASKVNQGWDNLRVEQFGLLELDDCTLEHVNFFRAESKSTLNISRTVLQNLDCGGTLTLNNSTVENTLTLSEKIDLQGSGNVFTGSGIVLRLKSAAQDLSAFSASATQEGAYILLDVSSVSQGEKCRLQKLGDNMGFYALSYGMGVYGELDLRAGTRLDCNWWNQGLTIFDTLNAEDNELNLFGHSSSKGGSVTSLRVVSGGSATLTNTHVTCYAATQVNNSQVSVEAGGVLRAEGCTFTDTNFFSVMGEAEIRRSLLQNLTNEGKLTLENSTLESVLTLRNGTISGSGNLFTASGAVIQLADADSDFSQFHAEAEQQGAYIKLTQGRIEHDAEYHVLGRNLNTYKLGATLQVYQDASLTLNEGVVVESDDYSYDIVAQGKLLATDCTFNLMGASSRKRSNIRISGTGSEFSRVTINSAADAPAPDAYAMTENMAGLVVSGTLLVEDCQLENLNLFAVTKTGHADILNTSLGSMDVAGSAHLEGNEIFGTLSTAASAEVVLTGSDNIFHGSGAVIRINSGFVDFSGFRAEADSEDAYIELTASSLSSSLHLTPLGETLRRYAMENPLSYCTIWKDLTLSNKALLEASRNYFTVNQGGVLAIESGAEARLGSLSVSGMLSLNDATLHSNGTIGLYQGAVLSLRNSLLEITNREAFHLYNWSGDTSTLWSAWDGDCILNFPAEAYVGISPLYGNTTSLHLTALPKGLTFYNISQNCTLKDLQLEQGVALNIQTWSPVTISNLTGEEFLLRSADYENSYRSNLIVENLDVTNSVFEGTLSLGGGTISGSGNTFKAATAIVLTNVQGDISSIFENLRDSTFTAANAGIGLESITDDARLGSLPEGVYGGYKVLSNSIEHRLELADGVALSSYRYSPLLVSGSLIAEGHNSISATSGMTLLSGAELRFEELSINGELTIQDGSTIQGHTLILSAVDALRIFLENWDGGAISGWEVENIILRNERARVTYEINGLDAQELHLTQELVDRIKLADTASVRWDLTLGMPDEEQNDTLILDTAIEADQVTVRSGSKLVLAKGADLRIPTEVDEYDGMLLGCSLTLEAGAELDCQGGMIDGRIELNQDAIISGTALMLGENAVLVLDGWEGDIAEALRDYFGNVQVTTAADALKIEINGFPEELVLNPVLQNTHTHYSFSNYMPPAQHVTVSACALDVGSYCSLSWGSEITLTDGARLYSDSLYGNPTLRLGTDSRLTVTDSTVDVCLDIAGGEISLRGAELTQQHVFTFTLTGENPTRNSALLALQEADYTCTHENAYAIWTTSYEGDGEMDLVLTADMLRNMTPKGCRNVAFGQCHQGETSTWTIGENAEWNLMGNSHVRGRLELQRGSSVRSIPGAETGRLQIYEGGVLAAEDALIDTELVLYEVSELKGHNWHFGEHSIVTYYLTEEFNIGEALSTPLDSLSYDVAPGAIFRLGISELAGDTTFTQETLHQLAPTGFDVVELSSLAVSGQRVAMNDLHFRYRSFITIEDGELLLQGGSLGQDDEEDNSQIMLYGGHLLAENADLNYASMMLDGGTVQLIDCQRVGRLSFSSDVSAEIHGCDLSESSIYIYPAYQGSAGVIDLSGNYWGTNDRALILSRIQNESNVEIRLDSIIEAPVEVSFGFAASQAMKTELTEGRSTIALTFNREVNADTAHAQSIRLLNAQGEELAVTEYEVHGRVVTLHADKLPIGSYTVQVNQNLTDTEGHAFSNGGTGEQSIEVLVSAAVADEPKPGPKVMLMQPNSTLFSAFRTIDLYFNQEIALESLSAETLHLLDEEGLAAHILSVTRQTNAKGIVYYHVEFAPLEHQGSYRLEIDGVTNIQGVSAEQPYAAALEIGEPDLQVQLQEEPLSLYVGRYADIAFTVTNVSSAPAKGAWYDSVYLCPTDTWDADNAVLLGRILHAGGTLQPGDSYTQTLHTLLNSLAAGTYYLFVQADSSASLQESNENNNLPAAGLRAEVRYAPHALGEQVVQLQSRNEKVCYAVTATETGVLSFTIDGKNIPVKVSTSALQTANENIATVISHPDRTQVLFSVTAGETYYLNVDTRTAGSFTTLLEQVPFSLLSVSGSWVASGAETTLSLCGAAFEEGMEVYLEDEAGHRYEASSCRVLSYSNAIVRFALPETVDADLPLTLRLAKAQGADAIAWEEPFTVKLLHHSDGPTENDIHLTLRRMGSEKANGVFLDEAYVGRVGWVWAAHLDIENTAARDFTHAFVLVTDTASDFSMYYSYDDSNYRDRAALLLRCGTTDQSPGVLTAGESETLEVYIKNYRSGTGAIEAEVLYATDTSYIGDARWEELESALRPATTGNAAWNAWWQNIRPRIGSTMGDFVRFISEMSLLADAHGEESPSSLADITALVMKHYPLFVPSLGITGTAEDGEGNALRGLGIELYIVRNGEREQIAWTETDDRGNYAIYGLQSGNEYEVVTSAPVMHDGHAVTSFTVRPTDDVTLNLNEPASVSRIDISLPGLTANAEVYMTGEDGTIIRLQGEAGTWVAKHVPEGAYTLTALAGVQKVLETAIAVSADSPAQYEFSTAEQAALSGMVTHADGRTPFGGVSLLLMRGTENIALTESDANGRYSFSNLPHGDYTVQALVGQDATVSVTLRSGAAQVPDLRLNMGHEVTGTIAGAAAGISVELRDADGQRYRAITDASGRFRLPGIPSGTFRLYVSGAEPNAGFRLTADTSEQALNIGVIRPATGMRLSGTLSNMGVAVRGRVMLYDGDTPVACAQTDAKGAFGFTVHQAGQYRVLALAEDGSCSFAPHTVVLSETDSHVTLSLSAGLGSLMPADPHALSDLGALTAGLYRIENGQEYLVATRNNKQELVSGFSGLAAGQYRLEITAEESRTSCEIMIEEGLCSYATFSSTELLFNRTLSVISNGKALANAKLYLYGEAGQVVATALTDDDGVATFEHMKAGAYRCVVLSADGSAGADFTLQTETTDECTVELAPLNTQLSGTITGISPALVGETGVRVYDAAGALIGSGKADSNGEYHLPILGAGAKYVRLYNTVSGQSGSVELPVPAPVAPPVQVQEEPAPPAVADEPPMPEQEQLPVVLCAPYGLAEYLNRSAKTVSLSWQAEGNPPGTTYEVLYRRRYLSSGEWGAVQSLSAGYKTSLVLPILDNSEYAWRVVAHYPEAESAAASTGMFRVDMTAPPTPSGLKVKKVAQDEDGIINDAVFSWNAVDDNSGLKGYQVVYNNTPFEPVGQKHLLTGTEAMSLNLADGNYYLWVQAVDNEENESSWARESFLIDTTGPSTPVITFANTLYGGTVYLDWSDSHDTYSGLDYYDIRIIKPGGRVQMLRSTKSESWAYLTNGTWTINVRAVDTLGNVGEWSADRTVTITENPDHHDTDIRLLRRRYETLKEKMQLTVVVAKCCSTDSYRAAMKAEMLQDDVLSHAFDEMRLVQRERALHFADLINSAWAAVKIVKGVKLITQYNKLLKLQQGSRSGRTTVAIQNAIEHWKSFSANCDRIELLGNYVNLAVQQILEGEVEAGDALNTLFGTVDEIFGITEAMEERCSDLIANEFMISMEAGDAIVGVLHESIEIAQSIIDCLLPIFSLAEAIEEYNQKVAALNEELDKFEDVIKLAENRYEELLTCIRRSPCGDPPPPPPPGPGGPGGSGKTRLPHETFQSFDPNDIYGPDSYGSRNWVKGAEMQFTVECENIAEENIAHTAMVTITQQIDTAFDYASFRLGDMMIAGQIIRITENVQQYTARMDWRESLGVYVDVHAAFDADTGIVTWEFTAIDPQTLMVVADPFTGLLAPNYTSPEGEGMVYYYVTPKNTAETGTEITAQADIVFDFNDVIKTPTLTYTLDTAAPSARVQALPEHSDSTYLHVRWSGEDEGSGIASYNVWVSMDGGDWELWQSAIAAEEALFKVEEGEHLYAFMAEATDFAGNQEAGGDIVAAEAYTISSHHEEKPFRLAEGSLQAEWRGEELRVSFRAESLPEGQPDWAALLRLNMGDEPMDWSQGIFSSPDAEGTIVWTAKPQATPSAQSVSLEALPAGESFTPVLQAPVRLEIQAVSYAAPTLYDANGDGLLDLLVGEQVNGEGKVRLYLNEGKAEFPSYLSFTYVQDDEGHDLTVPAEGCQGAIVRLADLSGNGHDEMIIGLADGTLRVFTAVAGGWRDAGKLTCNTGGNTCAVQVDSRSAPEFVDFNGDGRTDLLLGTGEGYVVLYLNTAAEGEAVFDGGRYLHDARGAIAPGSRVSPVMYDVDGDGLQDLVLGSSTGRILCYRNEGSSSAPLFAEAVELSIGGRALDLSHETTRLRLSCGDVNADGYTDLIIGESGGQLLILHGTDNAQLLAESRVRVIPPPAVPEQVQAEHFGRQISISWSAPADGDLSYEITLLHGGKEELISGIHAAKWAQTVPEDGQYIIRVRAVAGDYCGQWSADVAIDVKTLAPELTLLEPVIAKAGDGLDRVSLAWECNTQAKVNISIDGKALAPVSGTSLRLLLAEGEHTILYQAVDADGNISDVRQQIIYSDAHPSQATDISLRQIAEGITTADRRITDRIGGGDAQDYYRFTAAEDGTYAIGTDITTPDGSFLLSLGTVDAAGDYVVQRSLTAGAGSTNAIEGINLRKGETAYIRISSEAAAETAYELRVAGEVPAKASITDNNTAETAAELVSSPAPATVQGWVGAGDACDFYRLQLAEASNLQLTLSGVDTAARVKVYAEQADGSTALISAGTATAATGLDRTLALTSGSYFIEVAALNPDGGLGNSAYTMELKEQKGKQSTHYMLAAR